MIVLHVFTCYYILHNLIRDKPQCDLESFLRITKVKNQELSKVDDYEIVERTNGQIHGHEVDGYQKHTKPVIYMGCQQNMVI